MLFAFKRTSYYTKKDSKGKVFFDVWYNGVYLQRYSEEDGGPFPLISLERMCKWSKNNTQKRHFLYVTYIRNAVLFLMSFVS